MLYATYLENPTKMESYNRYDGYSNPVVLHKGMFHLGRFPSMEKLRSFMDYAGLKLGAMEEERNTGEAGMYRRWSVEPADVDDTGFTEVQDLPESAKPFTGLSNGRLVTCYLWNDGILHIRRPNPNYKDIYNPLSVEQHIAFCRENGYV